MRFLLTEDKSSMKNYLDHANVCTTLYIFLLMQNDDGTKVLCENDCHASDMDADDELNRPISDSQSNGTMHRQPSQCFVEKFF